MFTCRVLTFGFKYEAEEILRQRKLGFSFVRLLPKDTGVRPIVNLRRKRAEIKVSQTTRPCRQTLTQSTCRNLQGKTNMRQQSINDILQAAFQILTYEKVSHLDSLLSSVSLMGRQIAKPELVGASVFGHNEIYGQLKAFKTRLISSSPSGFL
jgi:telomerase reverse transcriptase